MAVKPESNREANLDYQLWILLFEHFQVERRNWSSACNELGLTLPQAHLLRLLTMGKPVKMNGLAEALDCDASNITGLVDKLETRHFIERQSAPDDRRVKMIALTKAGQLFRTKLLARLTQPSPSVTALPLKDKKTLLRIVKTMIRSGVRSKSG